MGAIYVYEPWPEAVDTLGLCGPLTPTSAKYTAAKNGDMEIAVTHPIDKDGKWSYLTKYRLLLANVPMRTTPIIPYGESIHLGYVTSLQRWTVITGATRSDRSVLTAPTEWPNIVTPIRLAVLPEGASVYVIGDLSWAGYAWTAIAWTQGRGWIKTSAIEYAETISLAANRAAIESVIPSPRTRPQLFRIYSVDTSESGVTVKAKHVSYDHAGVIESATAGTKALWANAAAIFQAASRAAKYVYPQWFTNSTDEDVEVSAWTRIGRIEAMLSTSESLTASWSTTILRDNWVYTFLTDAAYDSGYLIEYGSNLTGVEMAEDTSDILDSLIPVGQTAKGKPLTVPTNTYSVDGTDVIVLSGIVKSPNYEYPIDQCGVYDLGSSIKASGTGDSALAAAYVKLIRATLKKFADDKCDEPSVTLKVDFLRLGDTAEYRQFRDLDKLFMHDMARIRHPRLGIDATVELNNVDFDLILERYNGVELGTIRRNYARTRLASWQMPGISNMAASVVNLQDRVAALE